MATAQSAQKLDHIGGRVNYCITWTQSPDEKETCKMSSEAEPQGIQPMLLRDFVEALVDNRFSMLGAGALSNYAVGHMQLGHEHRQAVINSVRQGRRLTESPYPTEDTNKVVERAFNITKAYNYVLTHFIVPGQYVLNVNAQGELEIIQGNQTTREIAGRALDIARNQGEWMPRWEVEFEAEVTVRAKTPEEALAKAQKGLGDLRIDNGMSLEMLAAYGTKKGTLRLDRLRGLQSEDQHAKEWDEAEAKYPEYVRPSKDRSQPDEGQS